MPAKKHKSHEPAARNNLVRRHLLIGWLGLLLFLSGGVGLEILHGLKADEYLDVRNTTQRMMWRLSHAHGTLFSLVNVAFAVSVQLLPKIDQSRLRISSIGLTLGLVLLPLGFLLGGIWTYGGDPGLGILLVPLGALAMFVGVGRFVLVLAFPGKK